MSGVMLATVAVECTVAAVSAVGESALRACLYLAQLKALFIMVVVGFGRCVTALIRKQSALADRSRQHAS